MDQEQRSLHRTPAETRQPILIFKAKFKLKNMHTRSGQLQHIFRTTLLYWNNHNVNEIGSGQVLEERN